MEYLEPKSFIFILVWLLSYFFIYSLSKKNILYDLIALWICTITTFPLMAFLSPRDSVYIFVVIVVSIIFILLAVLETGKILEKRLPETKIFSWQAVIISVLYWITPVVGLVRLKIGYVLLFLSFLASLTIYKFFPNDNRINRVAQ